MRIRHWLFIVILLLSAGSTRAAADNLHYDAPQRFSLDYPAQLVQTAVPDSSAALLLKSAQGGYPTFNVIIEPVPYDSQRNAPVQSAEILESYRLVGLSDAKVLNGESCETAHGDCFRAQLEYTQSSVRFTSSVHIFSAPSRHFILTFISPSPEFARNASIEAVMVESFKAPDLIKRPALESGFVDASYALIVLLTVLCIALYRFRKRRA